MSTTMRRYHPDHPLEWIRLAKDDLDTARLGTDLVSPEILCFHAQQAVEKSLKAVLVDRSTDFPYTHDIEELLTTLEESGVPCPVASPEANRLTRYAVLTRYPSLPEPVTIAEYLSSLQLAENIVQWAEDQIDNTD